MIFAGLTSGYIVSQGGQFWVSIAMPSGFWWSTATMVVSSAFLIAAQYIVKKKYPLALKVCLGLAFLGSVLFGTFQLTAFRQLFESGNAVSGPIMTTNGRYGRYFSLTYQGEAVNYENDAFYWKGAPISDELYQKIKTLGSELKKGGGDDKNYFKLNQYGTDLMLYYQSQPITYFNHQLFVQQQPLNPVQIRQVYEFGENLVNDRGDFIMKGTYGADFSIYYNGQPLEYTNRTFYLNGKRLSAKQENDIFEQKNTASSFIYAFTAVHLLHWIGGVISLCIVFIKGLSNKYTPTHHLGITLGATYWHFLGALWLYLYLFLIYVY